MDRPALLRRLFDTRDARLALLIAPPGFGKTRLLDAWARHDERPFLWLSPRRAEAGLEQIARTLEVPFVAVLDRAELAAPEAVGAILERAVDSLPPGSTIALASRAEPAIPVARLRADHALVELRTSDLAMDARETADLLRLEGLDPSPEEAAAFATATEGWPAVLVLSALALRLAPRRPLAFDPAHHLIREYVCEEVLGGLPADLAQLAIRASVLETLSAAACDTVLADAGSGRSLMRLAALTPLLIPVDPGHHTFRWHVVMRDALRSELRRSEPELEIELHVRAAGWYRRWGDVERATAHAAAAGDAELVELLLRERGPRPLARGEHVVVRESLLALGDGVLAARPALALRAALTELSAGDGAAAREWARTGLDACDGESATAAQLHLVDVLAGTSHAHALAQAADAVAESSGTAVGWEPYRRLLRAVSLHLEGEGERAAVLLDEAIAEIGGLAPMVTALALGQRAMIALELKDWSLAVEVSERAVEVLEHWGLTGDPLSALPVAAAAAARAHEGRADEAKADLRLGTDLLTGLPDFAPWYLAECRILLAAASLWVADVIRARMLLSEASRLARRVPDAVVFQTWFDAAWEQMDTIAETSLVGASALTIAELRVLRFLPSHRSFREIGTQLGVSGNTIKTQAHAIYRKLGVASRSEAVARAAEAGLLGR